MQAIYIRAGGHYKVLERDNFVESRHFIYVDYIRYLMPRGGKGDKTDGL